MKEKRGIFRTAIIVLLVLGAASAGPFPQTNPQEYGPWNRDLEGFASSDGLAFSRKGTFVERGGVPTLARAADGRLLALFQWFPLHRKDAFDQVAATISSDGGASWTPPEPIEVSGLPDQLFRVFDPTLVSLPGSGFRLYFSSERIGPQNNRGNRAIFSSISSDGLHFLFEPGQRFGFEDGETFDCAVGFLNGIWHLYCPRPLSDGWGYHATSADGLNFLRQPDVFVAPRLEWLGNVLAGANGLWFYGSGGAGGWTAYSPDGFSWTLLSDRTGLSGDPAVVLAAGHEYLAVGTGPLRPDAKPGPPVFSKKGIVKR